MIEKSRIEDYSCDAQNSELFFHELSRLLRKEKKNPLDLEASTIAKAFHRVSKRIDSFIEKLEDDGVI